MNTIRVLSVRIRYVYNSSKEKKKDVSAKPTKILLVCLIAGYNKKEAKRMNIACEEWLISVGDHKL
jgi:hypothetical protein